MQTIVHHQDLLSPGARVRITTYGPFHRLRGTIRRVDDFSDPPSFDNLSCFYLIDLERASINEPVWFLQDEIEPFSPNL
jgi:uncharacterized circularly permuted ATP-grasp superfamily protein